MRELLYVTGNAVKFLQAQTVCEPLGLNLKQTKLDITEIQANTGETVARDKADKAFAKLQVPLVVSDDSWMIPGLKNFPGPYMKYMNEWFTSADWLRLTKDLPDRSITLRQIMVSQDSQQQKLFSFDVSGTLLTTIRGGSDMTHTNIVSFDGGQTSVGENIERKLSVTASQHNVWHEFTDWYREENAHGQ
jgi:inosine/xanthosine triphosphate pyrophosphatase family protein